MEVRVSQGLTGITRTISLQCQQTALDSDAQSSFANTYINQEKFN